MYKVLHIGFGLYPFWKGGMVYYQNSLMREETKQGLDVYFFSGGRDTITFYPTLTERTEDGVKIIELLNSPNHPFPNSNILSQCENKKIEKLSLKVLDRVKPNIVHLHDLRMHSFKIIDLLYERKIPMIKTMHNYYDICPMSEFLYSGKEPCDRFIDGSLCYKCIAVLNKKKKISLKERIFNTFYYNKKIISVLRRIGKVVSQNKKEKNRLTEKEINSRDLGYYKEIMDYRKKFVLERLNKLDLIHFYSKGSADIFKEWGLEEEKIRVIPVSSETLNYIERKKVKEKVEFPVIFGYFGGSAIHKGFSLLLEAFSEIDQKKAKLIIVGNKDKLPEKFKALNIEFINGFEPENINEVLKRIDVGIVPSLWPEIFGIVGIEFLNAGIPVIASNIGGITEWLKNGENGFLFEAGNVLDLREKISKFLNNPELIIEFQNKIKPWKSIKAHVKEILDLYKEIMNK